MTSAPRLESLDGKRIALLNNRKLNAAQLLNHVGTELRLRYDIAEVVTGTYPASRVMSADDLEALDACDAVVLANGD
jgi:hypothetical protein